MREHKIVERGAVIVGKRHVSCCHILLNARRVDTARQHQHAARVPRTAIQQPRQSNLGGGGVVTLRDLRDPGRIALVLREIFRVQAGAVGIRIRLGELTSKHSL